MRMNCRLTTSFYIMYVLLIFFTHLCWYSHSQKEFQVGVLLDMASWNGKMVHSCITMATSDFYDLNSHYKTRIVTKTSDSKGDPLRALEEAQGLMVMNVEAMIVGPEMSLDEKQLAFLGDKAKVPIFSLSGSSTIFDEYPYFFHASHSEAMQFEAIAALAESFEWKTIIFICEDTEYRSGVISYLFKSFQEKSIQIDYISSLPSTANDDGILEELHKLRKMQTTIFVLHMAPSLASRLVSSAKSLGMMKKGHAWILTDKTRNLLHSVDSEEHVQSMQGSLALKPYLPSSIKRQNFTSRWRKEYHNKDHFMNTKEISAYALWAYDAIWALARAFERVYTQIGQNSKDQHSLESHSENVGVSQIGNKLLLEELVKTRLKGLSGDFQIVNRTIPFLEAFEIVNVMREGERRVGFWANGVGLIRDIMHPALSHHDLEVIIWPGGSISTPRGAWPFMRSRGGKLRVGIPSTIFFKEFISLEYDSKTNTTIATGFCADVFKAAVEALPYEVPFEFIPGPENYSNLVYQIYLENFDTVVGDISITAARLQYVDFTIPYTDLGVGTIARVKTNKKDMWIFAKPIGLDLCLMMAVFFIFTGIVIWVIEKSKNKEFQGSASEQIGTIFFSTLFFNNGERLSSNLSRFVMLIWAFLVLILTSSYTATLASMLTVQQIGLVSKGANVGYQVGSFLEGNIVNNYKSMDYRLLPYSSTEQYADALSKGSQNGGIDGIIDEIPYIKAFLSKYSPDYSMVDSASTTNGFGFAFRKGSPLVPEISREIAKLREDGTLEKLEKKWYNKPQPLVNQETLPQSQVLKIDRFGGLFLICGISLGLALFVIMAYLIRKKLNLDSLILEKLGSDNLAIMIRHIFSSELKQMPV